MTMEPLVDGMRAAQEFHPEIIRVFFSIITSPKRRLIIQTEAVLKTFMHMGEIKSDDVRENFKAEEPL